VKKTGYILIFCLGLTRLLCGQVEVNPYPDNSPEEANFIAMGLTPPNQVWSANDYKKLIHLMDRIYNADKYSLPRQKSPYSGSIYQRMFNRENFGFLTDPNANLGNQIISYEKIKGIGYRILIYYIEDTEPEERFGSEVLDCLLLDGWLNMHGIVMYEKLANGLTPEQLEHSNFKRGYEETRKNYNRSMEELFYVLEVDYMRYDVQVLTDFVIGFGAFIHELPHHKDSSGYKERLAQLAKKFPDKNIKKLLKGFCS
jgi:hypothetical protein